MSVVDYHKVDTVDMLEKLGVKVAQTGEEISFHCPFPEHAHGDTNPSASMNRDSTAWICYGCKRTGNALTFVTLVENVTPMDAARWLRERYEGGFDRPEKSVFDDVQKILAPSQLEETKRLVPMADRVLNKFRVNWNMVADTEDLEAVPGELLYMLERGFSAYTLLGNAIGYDRRSRRITIPVRDKHGILVGIRARTPHSDVDPRYLVLGDAEGNRAYGFAPYPVSLAVWGIHRVMPGETAIVVEGELDGMALRQMGIRNAVSVCGSNVSNAQAKLIAERCERAVLFFDTDDAGRSGARRAAEVLETKIRTSVVPDHDFDPAEALQRCEDPSWATDLIEAAEPSVLMRV